jgi:hypothetical protein
MLLIWRRKSGGLRGGGRWVTKGSGKAGGEGEKRRLKESRGEPLDEGEKKVIR